MTSDGVISWHSIPFPTLLALLEAKCQFQTFLTHFDNDAIRQLHDRMENPEARHVSTMTSQNEAINPVGDPPCNNFDASRW